jgi:Zn finger protein HypA/HybF involved in hydrogenase expression
MEWIMAAHPGEKAREGGTFHCERCNNRVRVNKGDTIPKCPNCGSDTYDERTDETSGG